MADAFTQPPEQRKTYEKVKTLIHLEPIKLQWPHMAEDTAERNGRTTDLLFDRLSANDINGINMAGMNHERVPVDLLITHVLLHSSSISKRFLLPLQPPYQNWAQALACLS